MWFYHYLLTVDHYSDYIEVEPLENTLSSTVITKSKAVLCCYGIPKVNLTDNRPPLCSQEETTFFDHYGVNHITSSPYWAQSNGMAEVAGKILKWLMKKIE